ncbi:MAG: glycine C-acetyltransferase [Spirochaetota bacterium]
MNAHDIFSATVNDIRKNGLFKNERIIVSRQGRTIRLADGREMLNFCANNYLGLGGSDMIAGFAAEGLSRYGYGMNSVRFICGTQDIHRELEGRIAAFSGCEDAVLYSSAFDANGGLFETLLTAEDAVISDELNHASIIDGVRLCKAERKIFKHSDLSDLDAVLSSVKDKRIKLIATDGVFSMDGHIADLAGIRKVADRHGALLMIDDSHAAGVIGMRGRGTPEHCGVFGSADVITGTFGKALGGASGGYTATTKTIADLLRNRSRPYLFSNSLAPLIAYAENEVLKHLEKDDSAVRTVQENARYFRSALTRAGISILPGDHPIVPIMFADETRALLTAERMLADGIYVIGFCYPVVPKGKARIRVQISALHTKEDMDRCVAAFQRSMA